MKNFIRSKNNIPIIVLTIVLLISIVFLFIIPAITKDKSNMYKNTIFLVSSDKKYTFHVDIARTASEQQKGLMNRKSLKDNEGMIFVFGNPQIQSFWMKDTYIPLDIIFFDENKNYLNAAQNVQPCINQGDNCNIYTSMGAAKYVLEINGGWLKKNNLIDNFVLDTAYTGL